MVTVTIKINMKKKQGGMLVGRGGYGYGKQQGQQGHGNPAFIQGQGQNGGYDGGGAMKRFRLDDRSLG